MRENPVPFRYHRECTSPSPLNLNNPTRDPPLQAHPVPDQAPSLNPNPVPYTRIPVQHPRRVQVQGRPRGRQVRPFEVAVYL